jgi:hypothetical protein
MAIYQSFKMLAQWRLNEIIKDVVPSAWAAAGISVWVFICFVLCLLIVFVKSGCY